MASLKVRLLLAILIGLANAAIAAQGVGDAMILLILAGGAGILTAIGVGMVLTQDYRHVQHYRAELRELGKLMELQRASINRLTRQLSDAQRDNNQI